MAYIFPLYVVSRNRVRCFMVYFFFLINGKIFDLSRTKKNREWFRPFTILIGKRKRMWPIEKNSLTFFELCSPCKCTADFIMYIKWRLCEKISFPLFWPIKSNLRFFSCVRILKGLKWISIITYIKRGLCKKQLISSFRDWYYTIEIYLKKSHFPYSTKIDLDDLGMVLVIVFIKKILYDYLLI